jgi:hypothetical protein
MATSSRGGGKRSQDNAMAGYDRAAYGPTGNQED